MTIAHFFGLLHLAEGETSAMNMSINNFREQVQVYLNNAIILSKSLKDKEIEFTLITNNKKTLLEIYQDYSLELKIIEIQFNTDVPQGVKFYSAHFKQDVFSYISSLKLSYAVFCDLDMICINNVPRSFINIAEEGIPLVYEISDQVIGPFNHDQIIDDIEAITRLRSEGRWYGGEFISGSSSFFEILSNEINLILPRYFSRINLNHHVGDEAYVSTAIERIKRRGIYIGDAGLINIVGRYWSAPIKHNQKSFDYYKNCFLLHLPADKKFISGFISTDFKLKPLERFIKMYERYLILSKLNRFVLGNLIPKSLIKFIKTSRRV